jgi:hypothetical protein
MKLTELVQKESERTKEVIEQPKKVFKKERIWLEEENTIEKPLKDNKTDLSIENSIKKDNEKTINIEKISLKYVKPIEKEDIYRKDMFSIENKLETKDRKDILISIDKPFNFHSIVGLQQRTMLLIYEHCKMIGSKETSALGINFFTEKLGISQLNAHNALNELLRKNVIKKIEYKRGRGGYSRFSFEDSIWNIIGLNIEKISLTYFNKNIEQTIENPANSSGILSNSNNKNTTIQIPENLKMLISQKEIEKLIEKGITEESIEFSLKHFSYDLENNLVRSKTSPINMFYGILRGGNTYKSLKLMELENEELKNYQSELLKLEMENKRLKENDLSAKYQDFIQKNPEYFSKIREDQPLNVRKNLSDEVVANLAFQSWKEKNEL